MKLTPEKITELEKGIAKKFGARIKDDTEAAYQILEGLAETFSDLEDPAITSGLNCYIPRRLVAGTLRRLWCICHEVCHVLQFKKLRGRFFAQYFFKKERRTKMEVEAYKVSMEAEHITTGKVVHYTPDRIVDILKGYGIRRIDLFVARRTLDKRYRHVLAGRYATRVGVYLARRVKR